MVKRKHTYTTHRQQRQKRSNQNNNVKKKITIPPVISPTLIFVIFIMRFILEHISLFTGVSDRQTRRKDLEKDVFEPLGDYMLRRAYRMDKDTFYVLHEILEPHLQDHFFPAKGGKRDPKKNSYLIKTEIRLAVAIRYFAGGSPLDIMLIHGVSFYSVFSSVWGVVDCVNKCTELDFNFPTKEEQLEISYGYKQKSGALFEHVIGAIDGILIWILKPTKEECEIDGCQEGSFKCSRKDKFGFNMQAICDHKFRIRWIDLQWPGNSSDYMAWTTSELYQRLQMNTQEHVIPGMTIMGDSAYVRSPFMSVPFKNNVTAEKDAYNFYQSQLRITVEQTFGILVHRWAILRGPLCVPLIAAPSLVMALCRLHNFCIDAKDVIDTLNMKEYETNDNDELYLQHLVSVSNSLKDSDMIDCNVVSVDENGPDGLLNRGDHFNDCPHNRQQTSNDNYPMDKMLKFVQEQGLTRPPVSKN